MFAGTTLGETILFTALNLVFAHADSVVRVLAITHGAGGLQDIVGAGAFTVAPPGRVLVSTIKLSDN